MIYMLLVDGFEEIEALETLDIMRRAGLDVATVGLNSEVVSGAHNIKVFSDISFDAVDENAMEMLILPGGPGHTALDDERVYSLIDNCVENDKYIAAICAAPSIVGKRGIAEGKKVTCFPGFEQYMLGADVTGAKLEHDGKLITAKGAGAAADFGFEIVEVFKGTDAKNTLKAQMQY